MKQERDAFSSWQSLIKVHTVADRLAALGFQGEIKQELGQKQEGNIWYSECCDTMKHNNLGGKNDTIKPRSFSYEL